MRKIKSLLLPALIMVILASCGGFSGKSYYVNYTDNDGNKVSLGDENVTYTFTNGIYLNSFSGTPTKVVQFQFDGEYTPEEMVGKTIDVMIWETEKSIIWSAEDFDAEKTFKCTVESFEFYKKGMFDDKTYKLVGNFDQDGFKEGKLCLQVNI